MVEKEGREILRKWEGWRTGARTRLKHLEEKEKRMGTEKGEK